MDAHKTKAESILMRNRTVEAFNRKSQQHELEGIKQQLSRSNLPYKTNYELQQREKH